MLDVAVTNAFVLYNWGRMERGEKAVTENYFQDALILQIINRYRHQPHHPTTPVPQTIPPPSECRVRHGSILTSRKERYSYCQFISQKSWTSRHCIDYPHSPALCQTAKKDCHALWHSAEFDISRSIWFSKRLTTRPSTTPPTSLATGTSRKRGRPAGSTNIIKRRGFTSIT